MSLKEDFLYQTKALNGADVHVVTCRIAALLEWMESQAEIKKILDDLRVDGVGKKLLSEATATRPPQAKNNDEIAMVGLEIMERCKESKVPLWEIARKLGIEEYGRGNSVSKYSDKAVKGYIEPFLNYILRELPEEAMITSGAATIQQVVPVAIQESLQRFRNDYPEATKVCFIMMKFGETSAHEGIERAIKAVLSKYGFTGLLARDREYHEDLYPNIQTYMHGCGFGIGVFERIQSDDFNPNVSLEVGYLLGLKKRVLLLKDKTLSALQTDLVGKLYRNFDPLHPDDTIAAQVEQWLEDKGMI